MFGSKRISSDLCELLFATLVPYCQCDINSLLEFNGRIDPERLTNAFLAALADEPMWSHRFVPAFWRPYWMPIPRSQRRSLIQVVTTDVTQKSYASVLRAPVDAAARVFLFRGTVDDTLLIRVDHRLADATAARFLTEAVAAHYAAANTPATEDVPLIRRTMKLLRPYVSIQQRKKNLAEIRKLRESQERSPAAFRLPRVSPEDPGDIAPLLRFPESTLKKLTARALRDRGTPTIAIMAATYLALRDILGIAPQAPLFLFLTVNLRRYLPVAVQRASAGMFLGREAVRVDEPGATTMAAVMDQLRAGLAMKRGPQFGLVMSTLSVDLPPLRWLTNVFPFALLRFIAHRANSNERKCPDIAINDLGEFGRLGDCWGDAVLRSAYHIAGIWGQPGSVSICSSTCGSQLTVTVGTTPRSFAVKLAATIHKRLGDYVG